MTEFNYETLNPWRRWFAWYWVYVDGKYRWMVWLERRDGFCYPDVGIFGGHYTSQGPREYRLPK